MNRSPDINKSTALPEINQPAKNRFSYVNVPKGMPPEQNTVFSSSDIISDKHTILSMAGLELAKGKYLVAVSGGVDSVVLLNLLVSLYKTSSHEFVVAHFDHGIRPDSANDAKFVAGLAKSYGLDYVTERSALGTGASEEVARNVRYEFLRRVRNQNNLDGIVTAHHQDDLIETIFLHIMRGTGRHGLDPMSRTGDIVRPLLQTSKKDILDYAHKNNLVWHEDSTNTDESYARNALRQVLTNKMTTEMYNDILKINNSASILNVEIDKLLNELDCYVQDGRGALIRSRFVVLPVAVACECVKKWLTVNGVKDVNKTLVYRALLGAKTLGIGKKVDCGNVHWLKSGKTTLEILRK